MRNSVNIKTENKPYKPLYKSVCKTLDKFKIKKQFSSRKLENRH